MTNLTTRSNRAHSSQGFTNLIAGFPVSLYHRIACQGPGKDYKFIRMAAVGALDEEERQQVLYGSTMMSSLIVPVDPIEVDNGYAESFPVSYAKSDQKYRRAHK